MSDFESKDLDEIDTTLYEISTKLDLIAKALERIAFCQEVQTGLKEVN